MGPPYSVHPALSAANEKLCRAGEHLHTLTEELTAFRKDDPHSVTVDFEPDTGWWVAKARVSQEPEPRLSVLVGEIAYECLSALNHLVWELASRKVGRRKVFAIKGQIQFPTATTPGAWTSNALVHHKRVSKKALAVIQGLQPYKGPNGLKGAATHPLSLIKEIADADKHRVLAAAFALPEFVGVGWLWDPSAEGPEQETLTVPGRSLHDGSPLARIRFQHRNEEAHVSVHGQQLADIHFRTDSGSVRHQDLIRCVTWAKGAWGRFAPLFPPK